MPSYVISNVSGGDLIFSGGLLSGIGHLFPQSEIQLRASRLNSGNCYIGLSGGVTITSGQQTGSGGMSSGMLDGMILGPGDAYVLPRMAFPMSGIVNLYCLTDGAGSGRDRIYMEIF